MRDPRNVLREVWGFPAFRPRQEEVVRAVLNGADTLALLPTGGGKSLCFQVPALAMERLCLVVSPLIALMNDQVERLRAKGIAATAITSAMERQQVDNALESAAVGRLQFLYVSPERLGSELFKARLPRLPIGLIAVDEAHCISQWGYDFRPSYLRVAELRDVHPHVPVLALTASATEQVAQDIMARLRFRAPNIVRGTFARPELTLWVARGEDKMGRLIRIAQHTHGSGIVYLRERRGTVRIARELQQHGISAAAYHAGLDHKERARIQRQWTDGDVQFVAATNAFGMGIDKADVRSVVHMEPPPDLESYYQEAGRAGRDGQASFAFLLVHEGDEARAREKFAASFPGITDVRRVYQAFADQQRIALGSGLLETYELDIRAIATRTALPASTIVHSLKALELDGSLMLSEGVHTPSRLGMRADQRTVYQLRVSAHRSAPLIEALLRMHGGLFEEPTVIDEERLAQHLGWSVHQVIARLHELHAQQVIFYRERSDRPTVTLLTPRRDAQRMMLDRQALQDRMERARVRMEAMLHYAFGNEHCREQELLAHFGEQSPTPCGRCDVCRARSASDASVKVAERTAEDLDEMRWALDSGAHTR